MTMGIKKNSSCGAGSKKLTYLIDKNEAKKVKSQNMMRNLYQGPFTRFNI
jgi:hypothetical protein